jgi:chromosome partitioning protein
MCDSRTNLYKVLSGQVAEAYQEKIKIFNTQIPATIKVGEAIYYGMSVEQYSPKATAGVAYSEFAKEVVNL